MARFRPSLSATLGTLALGAAFLAAGAWQLRRSGEKAALFGAFSAAPDQAALEGPVADEAAAQARYRRIVLRGRYDPARQILLDARVMDQRPGYEVLTPFQTGGEFVLVNRGWVPAAARRSELPDVTLEDDERQVIGQIDMLPRAALRPDAGEMPPEETWPRRLLFPTAAEISAAVGYPVHDYQVLLDPGQDDGYLRQWQLRLMGPEQHLAYAVQWFALAATLGVMYVALNLRKAPDKPRS